MTDALRRHPPSAVAINNLLLNTSKNPPFYPDDGRWVKFFMGEKMKCTPLHEKLRAAAALSAEARRQALAAGRTADKQGAFTTIILPNAKYPGETLIIKLRRNAAVGAGFGTFGGIVEPDEENGDLQRPLLRECHEEATEIIGKTMAAELVAIMQRGITVPLFKCRDDAHVIDLGWGWRVDANAHATIIDKPEDQKALVTMLAAHGATRDKHADTDLPIETDGIAIFSLDHAPRALARQIVRANAPQKIQAHHYGHEALGEIAAVEKTFQMMGIDYPVRWRYLRTPGILGFIAPKMGLQRKHIIYLLDDTLKTPMGTMAEVPNSAYRRAPARVLPQPEGAKPTLTPL